MRTEPGFVPISDIAEAHPAIIEPAHDGLFTSGTLGRYSPALKELELHQAAELQESAAD